MVAISPHLYHDIGIGLSHDEVTVWAAIELFHNKLRELYFENNYQPKPQLHYIRECEEV
jgi:hypothetical protein